jgi:hypothetical protein
MAGQLGLDHGLDRAGPRRSSSGAPARPHASSGQRSQRGRRSRRRAPARA